MLRSWNLTTKATHWFVIFSRHPITTSALLPVFFLLGRKVASFNATIAATWPRKLLLVPSGDLKLRSIHVWWFTPKNRRSKKSKPRFPRKPSYAPCLLMNIFAWKGPHFLWHSMYRFSHHILAEKVVDMVNPSHMNFCIHVYTYITSHNIR